MGLDISAYRRLLGNPVPPPADMDFTGPYLAANEEAFPNHMGSAKPGLYKGAVEQMGFRAGSYSGYNDWREWLAQLAGYKPVIVPAGEKIGMLNHADRRHSYSAGAWAVDSGPFHELINFSDCEGTIGPEIAAKLAQDFKDFQAFVDNPEPGKPYYEAMCMSWYAEAYGLWRVAFEMAKDGGAVCFH